MEKQETTYSLNPAKCEEGTAVLKISAEISSVTDGSVTTRSGDRTVIFNGDAWESELIWQAVQLIVQNFGMSEAEALEALEIALKNLRKST